jgi:ABC-2 type transport system ATP-binding protein
MLKVEHVTKFYGDFKAVDDLSFSVKPGEIFGLLGVNGAGKTTTFRMIMGLLEPTKGTITLDGEKIDYTKTDQIGFLTEERSLLIKLTVFEQAIFYGTLKSMSKKKIEERLNQLLDKFSITEYKYKKIKELSKGNQQKIQFIMAILNEPKLLILDEPFSGLDPFNVELFKKEILDMASHGSMIIFSSHRMEHVELFCRKLVVLKNGKPVLSGYLKDIKEKYQKKNILIQGNINQEELEAVDGVISVKKEQDYIVQISSQEKVSSVFQKIKNYEITKFVVEEPSLNEIFIETVGERYEK